MTAGRKGWQGSPGSCCGGWGSIPDLYGVVPAAGGDVFAVGRPCQGGDGVAVPPVGIEECAGRDVPYLYGGIPTAGGDVFAVGGPCQRADLVRMPGVGLEKLTVKSLPDAHGFV